jgi:hypothetical protein
MACWAVEPPSRFSCFNAVGASGAPGLTCNRVSQTEITRLVCDTETDKLTCFARRKGGGNQSASWDWPGSGWWRVDLHAHSPASYDFGTEADRDSPDWNGWIRAAQAAETAALRHKKGRQRTSMESG